MFDPLFEVCIMELHRLCCGFVVADAPYERVASEDREIQSALARHSSSADDNLSRPQHQRATVIRPVVELDACRRKADQEYRHLNLKFQEDQRFHRHGRPQRQHARERARGSVDSVVAGGQHREIDEYDPTESFEARNRRIGKVGSTDSSEVDSFHENDSSFGRAHHPQSIVEKRIPHRNKYSSANDSSPSRSICGICTKPLVSRSDSPTATRRSSPVSRTRNIPSVAEEIHRNKSTSDRIERDFDGNSVKRRDSSRERCMSNVSHLEFGTRICGDKQSLKTKNRVDGRNKRVPRKKCSKTRFYYSESDDPSDGSRDTNFTRRKRKSVADRGRKETEMHIKRRNYRSRLRETPFSSSDSEGAERKQRAKKKTRYIRQKKKSRDASAMSQTKTKIVGRHFRTIRCNRSSSSSDGDNDSQEVESDFSTRKHSAGRSKAPKGAYSISTSKSKPDRDNVRKKVPKMLPSISTKSSVGVRRKTSKATNSEALAEQNLQCSCSESTERSEYVDTQDSESSRCSSNSETSSVRKKATRKRDSKVYMKDTRKTRRSHVPKNSSKVTDSQAHEVQPLCNVYISNLPSQLRKDGLRGVVEEFGTVESVHKQLDKTYGFVSFAAHADALACIDGLDNATRFGGRSLVVRFANRCVATKDLFLMCCFLVSYCMFFRILRPLFFVSRSIASPM